MLRLGAKRHEDGEAILKVPIAERQGLNRQRGRGRQKTRRLFFPIRNRCSVSCKAYEIDIGSENVIMLIDEARV